MSLDAKKKGTTNRPTPLRFRFYLGGAVAVHLTASACLLYGLYQLQPLLFVLFVVGVGLEMGRRRIGTTQHKSAWQVPDAATWQRKGDRLADLIVESGLFKPNAIKYENILQLLAAKDREQRVQQHRHDPNGTDSAEVRTETEKVRRTAKEALVYREIIDELENVPAWVDWQKIERGRQVYADNLVLISAGLAIALIEAYSFPLDAQVLYISGGLTASKKAATRRLMETGYWVFTVMKDGLRVGSKGHAACVNVRLIHALARKLCVMSPEWSRGHKPLSEVDSEGRRLTEEEMKQKISENGVDTLLMKFVKLSTSHQHGQNDEPNSARETRASDDAGDHQARDSGDGTKATAAAAGEGEPSRLDGELPINQATLLGTLFLFCHVCLEVAQMRGARISDEEKESYWHLWRYIGHLIGIDDHVMPHKYDDGLSARLGALYLERQKPDYTSRLLTTSTVDAMNSLPGIPFNLPLFNVSIRKFLGEPLSDALGIEPTGPVNVAKWWMAKYGYVLCDLFNVAFPPLKQLQNYLFWRFIDEVYREYFTIHLPPPSLRDSGADSSLLPLSSSSSSSPSPKLPSIFCPFMSSSSLSPIVASSSSSAHPAIPIAATTATKLLRCPFGG